jgi:Activator of Hsp90 ATPase homolog 1-like protein
MTMRDDPLTLVTWHLEPTGTGTRVTLVHTGWTPEAKRVDRVDKTWASILGELKNVVERGDVSGRTKLTYAMMRVFTFTMPSKSKAENAKVPDPDAPLGR